MWQLWSRIFRKGKLQRPRFKKEYRPYYYCYSRAKTTKRKIIDPTCINPVYPVVELDRRILDEVGRLVSDHPYFQSIVHHPTHQKTERTENDRIAILQRIDEIDLQISRVIDLYQLGTISLDIIGPRTRSLQEEMVRHSLSRHKTKTFSLPLQI